MIKSVNIIGAGNVANYLISALSGKVEIKSLYSRANSVYTNPELIKGIQVANELSALHSADLTIIAVKDDAIEEVCKGLDISTPVVHTSGSVGIQVFEGFEKAGILYPLQTFSKDVATVNLDFPFLIESLDTDFQTELIIFSKTNLNEHSLIADSEKRATIHLSAVFINNFYTHLAFESEQILKSVNEDLSLLKPLMEEGLSKLFTIGTAAAQTGPARRGDTKVLKKQEEALIGEDQKELYRLFSSLIRERFNT